MRRWLPVICLLIASCGGSTHHYPVNVETNFLNNCEGSGGDPGRCQCLLTWLEKNVPQDRFEADDDETRAGGVPEDMRRAVAAC